MDEKTANSRGKQIEIKITVSNTLKWFFISKHFSLKKVSKTSLRIIERWFTTVADSEEFLELDVTLVAIVLSSSELLVDSELQVFDAMNSWLNHKRIERSKHAKYLLKKVRLSLLTVPALENILVKYLWITENNECSEVVKKVIEYKNKLHLSCTNILPTSRYCSQNNFKFVIVGGEYERWGQVVRGAFTVDGTNFSSVNSLPIMNYGRSEFKTVCIKGEIYVFGGYDDRYQPVMSVEKYSPVTKTWNVISQLYDERSSFCSCSFIDSLYVLGGSLNGITNSCLVFNTTKKVWKETSKMNKARCYASCVVFEGRIVVSGGYNDNDRTLNTVEAYDHIDNSWTNMPNMIKRRERHKLVSIKNKLFVLGGYTWQTIEVFDSSSKKFALLQYPSISSQTYFIADVTSIGNKVVMFSNIKGSVFLYDVENDAWSEKSCRSATYIQNFSCASLPH